jgi:type II secretory pathway pseudopilin PulG
LVELVIVVVVIGIIAAIAVPRISSGVRGSEESALRESLNALRTAIDMYAAEHHGAFPGSTADGAGNGANSAGALVNQLIKCSNELGAVVDVRDSSHPFGSYLKGIPPVPVGPNKNSTTVAIDATNSPPLVTLGTEGWVYNPTTGQIIANTDEPNQAGTRTYDEY